MKRKTLLHLWLLIAVALVFTFANNPAASAQQIPLAGSAIPQFVDPLPLLSISPGGTIDTIVAGTTPIELHMREFQANMMPSTWKPAAGAYTGTWVWGYINGPNPPAAVKPTYTGPVIAATRHNSTEIKFVNDLPPSTANSNLSFWKTAIDQTIHWADPLANSANMCAHDAIFMPGMAPMGACGQNYVGTIPTVPHLHGGEVPPVLDGGPDAWFTSDGLYRGHAYYTKPGTPTGNSATYVYPNSQEASMIWFHDHMLGGTRLNVYAGLAGAYPIIDPALTLPAGLHPLGLGADVGGLPANPIIPMVIQDRMFDTTGQLFFPADTLAGIQSALNPQHPFWVPEFVGDTIAVNGKVWPYLAVDAKRYRFLFLNGSNARTYELSLPNGLPMYVIGTDGGYLDSAVPVTKLLMMPGERYDVIIDFAKVAGKTLILSNTARTPYPKGAPPNGMTTGRIVQFRVNKAVVADATYNPAVTPAIRTALIPRLVNTATGALAANISLAKTRVLTLNEVMGTKITVNGIAYPGGPTMILVNNTQYDGAQVDPATGNTMIPRADFTTVSINGVNAYYSEVPQEGTTEVWEIVNLTADAHPIHLHLVQFQLINRQAFNVSNYLKAYSFLFPASKQLDPMTLAPYPGGVFIGGYGPPKAYDFFAQTANIPVGGRPIYGGNPDPAPYLQDGVFPPNPQEQGWKDTIMVLPGMVTRIAVRFTPTDNVINGPNTSFPFDPNAGGHGYVWHCHIIDHEDNEMMRPYSVAPISGATRTFVQGVQY